MRANNIINNPQYRSHCCSRHHQAVSTALAPYTTRQLELRQATMSAPLFLTAAYVAAVVPKAWVTYQPVSLITFHPIAACLLLLAAVYGITRSQSIRGKLASAERTKRSNKHFIVMLLAGGLLAGTFALSWYHKENTGRDHNVSFHEKVREEAVGCQ